MVQNSLALEKVKLAACQAKKGSTGAPEVLAKIKDLENLPVVQVQDLALFKLLQILQELLGS